MHRETLQGLVITTCEAYEAAEKACHMPTKARIMEDAILDVISIHQAERRKAIANDAILSHWAELAGPEAVNIRLDLAAWINDLSEEGQPGHEEMATQALIDAAVMCALAYPKQRERWATALYAAADKVATGGA